MMSNTLAADVGLGPNQAVPTALTLAIADYSLSLQRYVLWMTLAWVEIKVKYKRSVLGPFWITLSTGISIATIGPIYATLMGAKMDDYFSYLATSIVLWNFIAGTINETGNSLISGQGLLKDMKLPFIMFILKEMYKNLILLAHNVVIVVVLMFFFTFHVNILLFLLTGTVVCLNLFWIGIVLSILCTRFRDIGQIVASLIQVAFFVTPVMWQAGSLGGRSRHFVVTYNPLYYLIDIFRSPILYGNVSLRNLAVCVGFFLVGNVLAFLFFMQKRKRISYWL